MRLRSVQKSVVTGGSSIKTTTISMQVYLRVSAVAVNTGLNAPNGAYKMKNTESGEDLLPDNGKRLGPNVES